MAELMGFDNLPSEVVSQINRVVDIWKNHLNNQLAGVYLHGSIVLNSFMPRSSDIDLLVVVEDSLDISTKLAIAKDIIEIDGKPCPLEMSAVRLSDVRSWETPGNCVFHYSEFWKDKYLEKLSNPDAECYVVENEFPDEDVTSYIKLIYQCGIVLYGRDINEVFWDISDKDFWKAISADIENYNFHNYAPRYSASNILVLGRILSFKKTKRILSKYDAGLWMISHVPNNLKYLPELAMKIWYEGEEHELPEDDLEELRKYLIEEIKKSGKH
jgi:predicted nucleotidyltransferase